MATSTLIPVEEYLRTSYSPDCDYVDGEVLERNVGERPHSKLQRLLVIYLSSLDPTGIHVFPEQRVQVSATRFRVPDICVIAGSEPMDDIFHEPPMICIEILSPEDRASVMLEKVGDYLRFGVRYIWVLDPRRKRAYVCTPEATYEAKDGILRTEDPAIAVNVAEMFSQL
jgi:Uma2 family endonuclease